MARANNELPPLIYPLRQKHILFKPYLGPMGERDVNLVDIGYYFKFYNPTTDIKLIRYFLEDNGFLELRTNGL